jgi:hypothetical protein
MSLIGKLAISILGDDKEIKKAFSSIEREGRKAQRSLGELSRSVGDVGKTLTEFVTGSIVAAGTGLFGLAQATGDYADNLLDLVDITGLSTTTLQEFQNVATVAGVNFEGLTGVITKFQGRLPEIVSEGGRAYDTIKQLGINVFDASGRVRDMNDLFPEMITKLQGVQNIAERNAMAQQLFGRFMADLAPVLSLTSAELEEARKQAHELGLVQSEESLESANEFKVGIQQLTQQIKYMFMGLAVDLIPTLKNNFLPIVRDAIIPAIKSFADRIRDVITWFSNLSPETQATILKMAGLAAAIGPVLLFISKIIGAIQTLIPVLTTLKTAFAAVSAVMRANPIGIVMTAITALIGAGVLLYKNWDKVRYYGLQVWSVMKESILKAINAMLGAYEKFLGWIPGLGDQIRKARGNIQDLITKEQATRSARNAQYESTQIEKEAKRAEEARNNLKKPTSALKSAEEDLIKTQNKQAQATQGQIRATENLIQEREQLVENARKRLIEQSNTDIQNLKAREAEEIAAVKASKETAKRKEQAIADIQKYYSNERLKILGNINYKIFEAELQANNDLASLRENRLDKEIEDLKKQGAQKDLLDAYEKAVRQQWKNEEIAINEEVHQKTLDLLKTEQEQREAQLKKELKDLADKGVTKEKLAAYETAVRAKWAKDIEAIEEGLQEKINALILSETEQRESALKKEIEDLQAKGASAEKIAAYESAVRKKWADETAEAITEKEKEINEFLFKLQVERLQTAGNNLQAELLQEEQRYKEELEKVKDNQEARLIVFKEHERRENAIIDKYDKEKAEIEQEWFDKVNSLYIKAVDIRIAELDREKEKAIESARNKGAEVADIEIYYEELKAKAKEDSDFEREMAERELQDKINAITSTGIDSRIADIHRERDAAIKAAKDRHEDTAKLEEYYQKLEAQEREKYAEEREQAERDWLHKLKTLNEDGHKSSKELLDAELEMMEAEKAEAIRIATEKGYAIENIEKYFAERKKQILYNAGLDPETGENLSFGGLILRAGEILGKEIMDTAEHFKAIGQAIASGNWVSSIVSLISSTEAFSRLMEILNAVSKPLVDLLDAILMPIIRFIAGVWNWVIDGLAGINILGWMPFAGLSKYRIDTGGWDAEEGSTSTSGSDSNDSGGTIGNQIGEITGESRDLLVSLLSPLNAMPNFFSRLIEIGNQQVDLLARIAGVPVPRSTSAETATKGGGDIYIDTLNIENPDFGTPDNLKSFALQITGKAKAVIRGGGYATT